MKRVFILTISIFISIITLHAADPLVVDKLIKKTTDLTSSVNQVLDNNGNPCGLLKVITNDESMTFEGSIIGTPEYKNGEYWVYLSPGTYQIRIKTNSYEPLMLNFRDYNIQKVESKATYELTFHYLNYERLIMSDHKIIQGPKLKRYAVSILTLPYGWTIGGLSTLDYMKRLATILAKYGDGWGDKKNCTILANYESDDHSDEDDIYCYRLIIESFDDEFYAIASIAAGHGGFEDTIYLVE